MSAYDKWKTTDVDSDNASDIEEEAERRFIAKGLDMNLLTEADWEAMYADIQYDIDENYREPDAY